MTFVISEVSYSAVFLLVIPPRGQRVLSPSSLQSLQRVFRTGFSAHDITEPLLSCDQSASAVATREFMTERKLEVMGVRVDGAVSGYIERSSLGDGLCSDFVQTFVNDNVVLNSTPLAEVVLALQNSPRLFVTVFGKVGGIVTKTDLQKPPVRMWLFGMVTLIEMRMTQMIEDAGSDLDWTQYVSAARLKKADELLAERNRRNQNLNRLDCLQFSDKCQIIARCEPLRLRTRYPSRRSVESAGKKLERLRNNLAHAQDIIATDWEAVVDLSENLDSLLEVGLVK